MSFKELRHLTCEIRAASDSRILRGHAVVWDTLSQDLGGFKERFKRGAFSDFLSNGGDARALWNHEDWMILGRQSAGTLRLIEDDIGLAFEIDVPNTSYGNDALESIRRGDVNQMSFGFSLSTGGESLTIEKGTRIREVNKAYLYEVSPVTFPAYESSTVTSRCDPKVSTRFEELIGNDLKRYFLDKKSDLLRDRSKKDSAN
jgi:uncharacterized protein